MEQSSVPFAGCFLDLFCPLLDKHKCWPDLRATWVPCSFTLISPLFMIMSINYFCNLIFLYLGLYSFGFTNLRFVTSGTFQYTVSLPRVDQNHAGPCQRWHQRGWECPDAVRRVTWLLFGHHLHLVFGRAGRRPAGGQPALRAYASKTSPQLWRKTPHHSINITDCSDFPSDQCLEVEVRVSWGNYFFFK